jgi:ferredoxin
MRHKEARQDQRFASTASSKRQASKMQDARRDVPTGDAGPRTAALLAADAVLMPDVAFVGAESSGVVLVYGRDETAIEAGRLLEEHLDVTVLIVPPATTTAPDATDFPVVRGRISIATGHLGAFDIAVDEFAKPVPSSHQTLMFGPSRNAARSRCDIILDLSGGSPLFTAADLRDGYLRADPGNRSAVLEAVFKARDLTGSFEKPRYVAFDPSLCAHSRSGIVGCRRCLDLCPAGAITPVGDHVAIDPNICAGCGQCAAVCPTGAASYAMPPVDALLRKLRTMLLAYRDAGGTHPIVLVHDGAHGAPMLDALARFGDGLPAHVLPLAVNEVTQTGLEGIAAAFAYGASAMRFLLRDRPRHDISGLRQTLALAEPILAGLGFGGTRVATIETDDPDMLGGLLCEIPLMPSAPRPASFRTTGGSAMSCDSRCANSIGRHPNSSTSSRFPRARHLVRWRLTPVTARFAWPVCRRVRPARCGTIRSDRCCASLKTPACSADCARRPVPKTSLL